MTEVVCDCGFRRESPSEEFRQHMQVHAQLAHMGAEPTHYWHPEIDGVAQDRMTRAQKGQ